MDQSIAEIEYAEMRQQIADQSAEFERIDRKATALITPIGLLVGLAINARSSEQLTKADILLFCGLVLLVLSLLFGVLAIRPRKFSRAVPDPLRESQLQAGGQDVRREVSWWRRVAGAVGANLQNVGQAPAARRRATEGQFFQAPGWARQSATETLVALTEEWAAAWRSNSARAATKVQWLFREYVTMVAGTIALVCWYAARTLH